MGVIYLVDRGEVVWDMVCFRCGGVCRGEEVVSLDGGTRSSGWITSQKSWMRVHV